MQAPISNGTLLTLLTIVTHRIQSSSWYRPSYSIKCNVSQSQTLISLCISMHRYWFGSLPLSKWRPLSLTSDFSLPQLHFCFRFSCSIHHCLMHHVLQCNPSTNLPQLCILEFGCLGHIIVHDLWWKFSKGVESLNESFYRLFRALFYVLELGPAL